MKQRSYLTLIGQWLFHCNFLVGNVQLSDMPYSYDIQKVTTTMTTTTTTTTATATIWWNIVFILRSFLHKEQMSSLHSYAEYTSIFNVPNKCSSRTLVACWTTHCVKAIPVLHTFSLLFMSLQTWQLQNCARTWYLEILFGSVFTNFMVYFDAEISDFQLCCGCFSITEI
jgi:hypothetical protein